MFNNEENGLVIAGCFAGICDCYDRSEFLFPTPFKGILLLGEYADSGRNVTLRLMRILLMAEEDISHGRYRPSVTFLQTICNVITDGL